MRKSRLVEPNKCLGGPCWCAFKMNIDFSSLVCIAASAVNSIQSELAADVGGDG